MPPTKVFSIRASKEERVEWGKAASAAEVSFNKWVRRVLNQQVRVGSGQ